MEDDQILLYRKQVCGSSRRMLYERCWNNGSIGMKVFGCFVAVLEYPIAVAYQIPAFYTDVLINESSNLKSFVSRKLRKH